MSNRTTLLSCTAQLSRHLSTLGLAGWLVLGLSALAPVSAQSLIPGGQQSHPERALVVAAATDTGVRFTAASDGVAEMRLEVFSFAGEKLFDSDFRRGSVLDWAISGPAAGQSVTPDDDYLCVVTLRDLSGRLRQRRGITSLRLGSLTLRPPVAGDSQLSSAQVEASAASRPSQLIEQHGEDDALTISTPEVSSLTLTAHDGQVGQLTSTTGPLTFRTGDIFAGKDIERMRLTPEGNLGIGTDNPQATLDVAGSIRATGALWAGAGVEFADGSRLNSAAGKLLRTDATGQPQIPEVDGSGTTGRLTKWTNGPTGTLGDSVVTETSGKLGIGTATPNYEITLFGNDVGLQLISPVTGTTANDGFRFGISSVNNAFLWNTEATDMYFGTTATERMRIKATGNVGIGTSNPAAALDVVGNIKASGSLTGATGSVTGNLTVDTNTLHVDATNNRIGIGTTTPSFPLDVVGGINTSTQYNIGGSRILSNPGVDNLFAGVGAGAVNTGSANSFFGKSAGAANTTGNQNSFFGGNAGDSNTTGSSNSFVGYNAGTSNTLGFGNSFFGKSAGELNTAASSNSFFGYNAGGSNMTGERNSFFGYNAGYANTTSGNNSLFGYNAGFLNTGIDNSFFGSTSGAVNTTGSQNSFFGQSAGAANTTGLNNSFFGKSSGAANTTGTSNSFFGLFAGGLNTTGASNSFFGAVAGAENTIGANNSFFGNAAGTANTTGSANSFFGGNAGDSNTAGNSNSFFGHNAGTSNTLGTTNSFFGGGAGQLNTTASRNSFFGYLAGSANMTGSDNSFFGASAGANNSSGLINSFFGNNAGSSNTTGSSNSFFGMSAGVANTTGGLNSFFGVSAGLSNTTGNSNSFFGGAAGSANSTGDSNSFFGRSAGLSNTTATGNSFFGNGAGDANTTGSTNTFVGNDAGESNTTEDNNTFVGANSDGVAGITNATAVGANAVVSQSDSLVLGNGVKVGIGSSTPAEKLQVNGNIFVSGNPGVGSNGLILKSPNNATCAKLTIDNAGALVTTIIACP